MCIGGGGGGGGAAEAARAEEEARQARIAETIATVRGIFEAPGREKLATDHRENVFNLNLEDLEREKADADRNARFQLARQGLSGGSADAVLSGEVLERFNEGVSNISDFADSSANQIRTSDERAKQALIRDAQTGLDATTAQQNALNALSLNLEDARASTKLQGLGNLFSDLIAQNNASAAARGAASAKLPFQADSGAVAPRSLSAGGGSGRTVRIG